MTLYKFTPEEIEQLKECVEFCVKYIDKNAYFITDTKVDLSLLETILIKFRMI
jgi:hypothetical protein